MSDTLTLREAFDKYLSSDVRMRTKGTQEGYRGSLRKREAMTCNPSVGAIDDATVTKFRDALIDRGLAPSTVRGQFSYLNAILNRLSPAHPHNRQGLGIIQRVPYCTLPKIIPKFPRIASTDELNRLYHACEAATWPARLDCPAAAWWRALLVTLYNCGPRRRDLQDLRTSDVSLENQTLSFAARKNSRLQVIPLNTVTVAHLASIWNDREKVFPTTSKHALYRQWHAINAVANISERLTFQDIRATCGSAFANSSTYETAKTFLGHRPNGVTATFYIDPRESIRKTAEDLPQPNSFLTIFDRRPNLRDVARPKPKRRADWAFAPGEAVYHGHVFRLGQKPLAVLTMLVTAARPVPSLALRKAVWYEKTVSTTTVKTTIAQLRRLLKCELGLPDDWNPLPNDQKGEGWTIQLPATEDQ